MRRPNIIRPIKLHTALPEDVYAKLTLHLYSDLEGAVPKGAYQAFFTDRINEFFDSRSVDLAKYLSIPTQAVVRGSPGAIELLEAMLRRNYAQP